MVITSPVCSYILQAWMEKYQASSNMDQLLDLCQMQYVEAEVLTIMVTEAVMFFVIL
jgi:hypothetical protein